jgi:hypothetical protein
MYARYVLEAPQGDKASKRRRAPTQLLQPFFLRQGIHSLRQPIVIVVITISTQLPKQEAWRVVFPNNSLDTRRMSSTSVCSRVPRSPCMGGYERR